MQFKKINGLFGIEYRTTKRHQTCDVSLVTFFSDIITIMLLKLR